MAHVINTGLRPLPEFGTRKLSRIMLDEVELENVELELSPYYPWGESEPAAPTSLTVRLPGTKLLERPTYVELVDENRGRIFYGETMSMDMSEGDTILVLQRCR